eukprot:365817-Chlamydomonas_euryale.AAC.25
MLRQTCVCRSGCPGCRCCCVAAEAAVAVAAAAAAAAAAVAAAVAAASDLVSILGSVADESLRACGHGGDPCGCTSTPCVRTESAIQ